MSANQAIDPEQDQEEVVIDKEPEPNAVEQVEEQPQEEPLSQPNDCDVNQMEGTPEKQMNVINGPLSFKM